MSRVSRLVVLIVFSMSAVGFAQYVEQNVNMVAGTDWPNGDPFLQKQNEPSVAISTRNPLHLLAGANDYRTVDIPFDTPASPDNEERGDAWLGVFKSRNGGQSWWSNLLDGYPQLANSTSPLHGYQAGADAVVRSGPNGMFYYSGIVLNRDPNPLSGVFVARFIDNNNTENGDPFGYLNTVMVDRGTSGAFIDKPWVAVGPGTGTCSVTQTLAGKTVTQTFPGQNIYLAYTIFVGGENNIRSKLMFARSTDCGATWSASQKLSEGYPVNQGASIVVSPTGPIYVVWRQFKSTTNPDSILIAKSTDGGQTFSKAATVRVINPFEQGMTSLSIRTNAYAAAAADANGRLYIAWSDRGFNSAGDGRIVMMSSPDGVTGWTGPIVVDPGYARGQQFMPTITVVGGKIVVAFYDLRDDSTIGVFTNPSNDGQYTETRQDVGDRPGQLQFVFLQYLLDQAGHRRHTLDLRAARASVNTMGAAAFDSFLRVSRYRFGIRPASSPSLCATGFGCVEQLQFNVPNLPLFRAGSAPFLGDYIDITGYSPRSSAVYHVVWTDNRDVRPPKDGNWANYTAVSSPAKRAMSLFNGQAATPCVSGQSGIRNQNIYSARVSDGLFAGATGNAKTLGLIQRTFAVFVQNAKATSATFRLTISQQPPAPGQASFDQFALATFIDVPVPPHSTATRTVYVSANDPHWSTNVDVTEFTGVNGTPVPNGLTTTVVTNPDPTNPDPTNPDPTNPDPTNPDPTNPDPTNGDIANSEVHTVDVSNPDPTNPDPTNTTVTNPDPTNPDPTNPDPTNPDPTNADLANSAPSADVTNATVPNADVLNPDPTNSSVTTDTTWTIHNRGNTTSGYEIKLVTNTPIPAGVLKHLIVYRNRQTPAASSDSGYAGCTLTVQKTSQLITNIVDPKFTDSGNLLTPDPANATLWLDPGDGARITLRIYAPLNVTFDPATSVAPVAVAQANNNINGVIAPRPSIAAPLFITTTTVNDAVSGQSYTTTFNAIGGKQQYAWSATTGIIDANGVYSNVFRTSDSQQTIVVTVTDANGLQFTMSYPVNVYQPLTITTASLPSATVNLPYSTVLAATGGKTPYTWSLYKPPVPPPGLTFNAATGQLSGTPTSAVSEDLIFQVADSAHPMQISPLATLHFSAVPSFTAVAHLKYNGQALKPSTAPDMFAENLDTNTFLDPSQIVWNHDDTVSVLALTDAHYVLEVASRESAPAKYYPGGFWNQVRFQIADTNLDVDMLETRLIHVTSPADNATTFAAFACPPQLSVTPTQISWEAIDIPNVTYTYYVNQVQCATGSSQLITSGSTTSLSVPLTLSSSAAGEYYTIQLYAYSPTQIFVGQIMSVGTNWYGWDIRFTVP